MGDEQLDRALEDGFVRRFVAVCVHVRNYAPYYAVTVALVTALVLLPRADRADDADRAGATGATGAASRAGGTSPAPPSSQATSSRPVRGIDPSAAGLFQAPAGGADGDARAGGGTAATGSTGVTVPAAPAAPSGVTSAPDVPDPGLGYGSDDTGCTLHPPSPAPAVTPAREVGGAQETAEAAAGVSAPVNGEGTVETVEDAAGCTDPFDSI